jgi:predicted nucleic acid-binding protein
MSTTLVDSNVLLDYLTEDSEWSDWSAAMLVRATDTGALAINQVIFAEASVRFETIEEVDRALPEEYFKRAALPWEAAYLAAKIFAKYRRRGGTKTAPLPDFFIGAHAAVTGMTLLTRDARRYRAYFPKLRIIAP